MLSNVGYQCQACIRNDSLRFICTNVSGWNDDVSKQKGGF